MRNTDMQAGTSRAAAPSRTASPMMCAATSMRPLGSMWKVRQWMPRRSTGWLRGGSPRGGVDRIDREVVFPADEDFPALEFRRSVGAVHAVHETAVGVHAH